jgi:signal peptide peptidase SppA
VKYPHIAARIFNTPLLIHPQKLDAIVAGLGPRVLGVLQGNLRVDGDADAIAPADSLAPELFSTRKGDRVKEAGWPGYKNIDGVAVVSANGALVHKTAFDMDTSNLLLGYNDLTAAMEHAADNTDVHAILQVWDSPGGEVQGAFEHADRMEALRAKGKPIYAIADGMMASAAYLGASAVGAEGLAVTATGYAGSIGVVMRHVDFSRMLANDGVSVTHIFAGAHKVDGNPYQALPEAVRADFQSQIYNLYSMFVSAVARYTGMSEDAVRATEARVFMGKAAVDSGLASRVTTTDALITELAGARARVYPAGVSGTGQAKGTSMTTPNAAPVLTQADIDKARAEGFTAGKTEGHASGLKEGIEVGAKSERERTAGIMAHKEAEGRSGLAAKCVATGLSVDQAGELLAASPKQSASAGATFAAAMSATGNPGVKAGETDDVEHDNPQAIGASWDRAFGVDKNARKH